jgi:cell division transport system permease protein
MSGQEEKIIGRRLKASYVTTVASITLVLFVLGLLGMAIMFANQLSDHVKENFGFTVFLHDTAGITEVSALQQSLEAMDAVKDTRFVSRDDAAKQLTSALGEDFVDFLGYNPLSASIIIRFNASHAQTDSLARFEEKLRTHKLVADIDYQKDLIHLVNENIRKIGLGLLIFSILLVMIASALISNTIRLGVFAKRFIIKSMQLVGATQAFIRKPFITRGVMQGFISALLADGLLLLLLYVLNRQTPGMIIVNNPEILTGLLAVVILLGLIISWISTWFAVRKYLKIKTDSLYYY